MGGCQDAVLDGCVKHKPREPCVSETGGIGCMLGGRSE